MNYEIKDVREARTGSETGFANLYQSIYEDLFKMAYYMLGNREWALDIVSDTVLDVYREIEKLKDEQKFEQWILKILTNKCKRKLRDKYEKLTTFHPQVLPISQLPEQEGRKSNVAEYMDVRTAMQHLKEKERMIVILCVIEGYKSQEVAEILHMNAATVRSKLNRSLAKMKAYIEG